MCLQAASYGKSVGGVFIVVLRITIKGLLPAAGHFGRLRVGVCIHLALAAVILLGCALVTSLAIPYLVDLVQQTESTEVPPGLYTRPVHCARVCLCLCGVLARQLLQYARQQLQRLGTLRS